MQLWLMDSLSDRRRTKQRHKRAAMAQLFLILQVVWKSAHYFKYVHKVPCYTSEYTGERWIQDVLAHETDLRCVQVFRMRKHVFTSLCSTLQERYGLRGSNNMTVMEKVGIFVNTMAWGASLRDSCERFQCSTSTISDAITDVLESLVGRHNGWNGLARDVIKPVDPHFSEVPKQITEDIRYSRYFKGCIGALDGTHIEACIPQEEQLPYRGRKGITTFNVLAVCDFDLNFTFVSAGWEGSAHDARVLEHALSNPGMHFPHPPPGRYYLCDKGYPERPGYMIPYSKTKYHRASFVEEPADNEKEAFNQRHSSLRGAVKRTFGIFKSMWKIMKPMHKYPVSKQVDIIIACMALHNFIRRSGEDGEAFDDTGDDR